MKTHWLETLNLVRSCLEQPDRVLQTQTLENFLKQVRDSSAKGDYLLFFGLFDPSFRQYCFDQIQKNQMLAEQVTNVFNAQTSLPHDPLSSELTTIASHLNSWAGIEINVESSLISQPEHLPVTSTPLARLCILLSSRKSVSFEEVLAFCFDIAPYNRDVHASKVHNLLFRAKNLLGREVFYSRREVIFVRTFPERVRFLTPPKFQSILLGSPSWHQIKKEITGPLPESTSSSQVILRALSRSTVLSRHAIQNITGLSKASVSRHLKDLISKGEVAKVGASSIPNYSLNSSDSAVSTSDSAEK